MKEAGILTFHNAENFGAALQAFALQETIKKFDYNCEIIDYRNKGVFKRNSLKNIYYLGTFQNPIKNYFQYKRFRDLYLNLSKNNYRDISIFQKDSSKYQVIFFGSDQIWNPDLSNGFDDFYFGNFASSAKKIAYAASVGKDSISNDELEQLNKKLNNFDSVSVREESIANLLNGDVKSLLDPCLLLSKSEWENFFPDKPKEKNYILVYQLHKNDFPLTLAKSLSDRLNKKVLVITPYYIKQKNFKKLIAINPAEFINYFLHADHVITDSFHGTSFSILFEKHFYVVLPSVKTKRLKSILNKLNLLDRIIDDIPNELQKINYTDVQNLLSKERELSINFIKRNLP